MPKQLKADLMLILVTLCWGVSYLMMARCLTEIGPLSLNAYRFLIAFFAAMLLAFPKLKNVNKITLKYSALIGFSLVFVYLGATYGVLYTSLSNAGFLCALTVVITPILTFLMKRERPSKKMLLVLTLCLAGIAMMTLNEQLKPALGDLLCILCAFAFAIDLLIADSAVRKENVNAFQVGVYQLGFTGLYMLILSLILEKPVLPSTTGVWISLIFLAIFCTGVAFIAQVVAQQYTSATHVGVIFALEPIFAGVAAFFFASERLLPRAYFGAALLMIGILIMEIDFSALFLRRKTSQNTKKELAENDEKQGVDSV